MIPPQLARLLTEKANAGWSGRLTLNFKDGAILDYEIAEKHRIAHETDLSRAGQMAGGSGGRYP